MSRRLAGGVRLGGKFRVAPADPVDEAEDAAGLLRRVESSEALTRCALVCDFLVELRKISCAVSVAGKDTLAQLGHHRRPGQKTRGPGRGRREA